MKAARNLARDYSRNNQKRKTVAEIECVDFKTPEEVYRVAERHGFYRKILEPGLKELSQEQQEALSAYCLGDNLAQDARERGVSYSTFRSRYKAAIKILRHYVSSESE